MITENSEEAEKGGSEKQIETLLTLLSASLCTEASKHHCRGCPTCGMRLFWEGGFWLG